MVSDFFFVDYVYRVKFEEKWQLLFWKNVRDVLISFVCFSLIFDL